MAKQYLDKDGLEVVRNKVNEAREVSAGAMALAESIGENITPTFTGTFAQWNALSSADKSKYKIVNITDDTSDVQNAVRNPDWSRAVNYTISELYAGLQMPDDGIFIAIIQNRTKTNPGYENRLYIAGKVIGYCYEIDNIPEPIIHCQVPVNKGDSVSLDGPVGAQTFYNGIRFVPYKTEIVVTEPMNFSTEEQFTGKYWIDGKKIYRKYTATGTLPNNTRKSVPHNVSNLNQVIGITGMAYDSYGNQITLPFNNIDVNGTVVVWVKNDDIVILTTNDLTAYTESFVIIEYTK